MKLLSVIGADMCGIAGWVDFRRDVKQDSAAVRAMTATMALRGPDDEGIWCARHAGLGHRRLAVIDPAGGLQPMTAQHEGRVTSALTYSGEVYNYRELRTELTARGQSFDTASDVEVVLKAYLEWGETFLDRLNGMYAFALWDERKQRLLLVRDRMGVKPLFWYPTPDGALFGSEPKAVLTHPAASAVVDADGMRELLSLVKTPSRTYYRGLYEVEPGQVVTVDADGARTRRYWTLPTRQHTDDLSTTVHTVRELLDDIVTRQLISDVPLCTLLSGGLDSSAITALAAARGPVRSFAVDFTGQTENFQPDAMRDTPDGPFVHELAEYVKAEHTDIMLDTAALSDPLYRAGVMTANDAPNQLGDMYTSLYLLFRAVRERSTVALSGESADEVFGGYRWFHDPETLKEPTFPWLAALRNISPGALGVEDLLDPDLAAALDLPGYVDNQYEEALGEVEHLPDTDPGERRMREVCYLHLTRFVQVLLDRKDRMSMAHGLEVRVPFCDHRLVEYVYNTPWSMKTFDGYEKSLLRAATADRLPQSIIDRRKSPYPSTQDPTYEQGLRNRLNELLAAGTSPVFGLLQRKRLTGLLEAPAGSDSFGVNRRCIELALGLDEWLARTPVELAI
jgi:asparagine synthase (glutamine-hydrolysing)